MPFISSWGGGGGAFWYMMTNLTTLFHYEDWQRDKLDNYILVIRPSAVRKHLYNGFAWSGPIG